METCASEEGHYKEAEGHYGKTDHNGFFAAEFCCDHTGRDIRNDGANGCDHKIVCKASAFDFKEVGHIKAEESCNCVIAEEEERNAAEHKDKAFENIFRHFFAF